MINAGTGNLEVDTSSIFSENLLIKASFAGGAQASIALNVEV